MPLKTFRDFMTLCRERGITPTWDGLRIYAELHKKRMAPQPKLWDHPTDRATNPDRILSHIN